MRWHEEDYTKPELVQACKDRHLPCSGTKAQLCDRLNGAGRAAKGSGGVARRSVWHEEDYTKPELVQACKDRHLPCSGTKADLCNRLNGAGQAAKVGGGGSGQLVGHKEDYMKPELVQSIEYNYLVCSGTKADLCDRLNGASQAAKGSGGGSGQLVWHKKDYTKHELVQSIGYHYLPYCGTKADLCNYLIVSGPAAKNVGGGSGQLVWHEENYTKPELVQACKDRNLPYSGTKADLCDRLNGAGQAAKVGGGGSGQLVGHKEDYMKPELVQSIEYNYLVCSGTKADLCDRLYGAGQAAKSSGGVARRSVWHEENYTKPELVQACKDRHLPCSGTKADLCDLQNGAGRAAKSSGGVARRSVWHEEDYTKPELVHACKDRNLPYSGTKADLCDRQNGAGRAAKSSGGVARRSVWHEENYTKPELVQACKDRNLPYSGTKADLCDRLNGDNLKPVVAQSNLLKLKDISQNANRVKRKNLVPSKQGDVIRNVQGSSCDSTGNGKSWIETYERFCQLTIGSLVYSDCCVVKSNQNHTRGLERAHGGHVYLCRNGIWDFNTHYIVPLCPAHNNAYYLDPNYIKPHTQMLGITPRECTK